MVCLRDISVDTPHKGDTKDNNNNNNNNININNNNNNDVICKQSTAQDIPSVISSTAVIPKSLPQSLKLLNLHPNTYTQMQKCVILGTCSIVRNFLNYKRDNRA
jgi:hypothetical protein